MTKRLKIMPEYECFSLWDVGSSDNIDSALLPITDDLKERIMSWEVAYDATLNQDNPTASGFRDAAEESAFDNEGRLIWEKLKNELGDSYDITYFSIKENALILDSYNR